MARAVGIIVRRIKDIVYAQTGSLDINPGDKVIVETEHGVEAGVVFEKEKEITQGKDKDKIFIGNIIRIATPNDEIKIDENLKKSEKASQTVLEKVRKHNLDMKLTFVCYNFDCSKLFVYYTSDSRVDFRELIKDLGHTLKTRIQMVQIGVRDESKIVGGIGTCGQVLCCRKFLKNFNSVTIDMAKDQDLSLNTSKLSGLCGRLMCCIAYENEHYKNIKQGLPQVGQTISTSKGKGTLKSIDCIRESVKVEFGKDKFETFTIDEIKKLNKKEEK